MESRELELLLKQKQQSQYKVKGLGFLNFAVKDVDMTKRTVDVVLNTMNFLDSDMDMILPGAAKRSLKERGVDSNSVAKIKYLKDHDMNQSIGKWTELSEKEINYKGQNLTVLSGSVYLPETTKGQDQLIDYQSGIIDNHSIGFQYENIKCIEKEAHGNSQQWETLCDQMINPDALGGKDYFFAVKEINLFEGSSVAFGANSLTPYLGSKSGDKVGIKCRLFDRIKLLHNALKEGKQSDERMYDFELQIKQLYQLIDELTPNFIDPSKEKALEKSEQKKDIDLSAVAKKFELKF